MMRPPSISHLSMINLLNSQQSLLPKTNKEKETVKNSELDTSCYADMKDSNYDYDYYDKRINENYAAGDYKEDKKDSNYDHHYDNYDKRINENYAAVDYKEDSYEEEKKPIKHSINKGRKLKSKKYLISI